MLKINIPKPTPKLSTSELIERAKAVAARQQAEKLAELAKLAPSTPTIEIQLVVQTQEIEEIVAEPELPVIYEQPIQFSNNITLNAEQLNFVSLAASGQSCILIGAAGTGKTTSLKASVNAILESDRIPRLADQSHKYLLPESAGIVCTSYTRRSVANIKKAVPDLAHNCITIHKLLEYEPVFYEVMDETTGNWRQTMKFAPARHATRKLDSNIKVIIIDEAATVPIELFQLLLDALPSPNSVQFIYLGDLNQLPPVFGAAVLGYKGLELPRENIIELTQVYRQALESPIIRLAHKILSGESIEESNYPDWNNEFLHLRAWKKKIRAEEAMLTAAKFFQGAYDNNIYDPNSDMILMCQNINFGILELNKHIAQYQASINKKVVWEVIAGWQKHYFSAGDIVLYDKEDCEILEIYPNGAYNGVWPQPESVTLNYFGYNPVKQTLANDINKHLDDMIDAKAADFERTTDASHTIVLKRKNFNGDNADENKIYISSASEVNNLALGYCMTVHRSQGSEWRKVFFITHQSNAQMLSRELLYTAVTRAREELYIICEKESFVRGIQNQRIKGHTLEEKLQYFATRTQQSELV